MKQKSISWCLAVTMMVATFGLLFVSCGDDDEPDPMLEVSPENLQLDDNGEGTLTISSNTKWEVSTTVSWLSFSTMSGVGNGQVSVRANGSSTSDRTAIVTVKADDISRQAVVTQAAQEKPSEPETPTQEDVLTINVAGVTFKMIRVEGGTFYMGATAEQLDDADDDEKPAHNVTLSSYYIGETEVTQQLWQVVTGQKPTNGDDHQWDSKYGLGPNRPAYYISWDDCQEFITKLNALTGRSFRMPTEAEWEFAARGGNKSRGYKYAGSNDIGDVAWYYGNSNGTTHDVATKQPNELGVYDMSGNVFEWCSDWYDDNYYSNSPNSNPTGPPTGSQRANRGGSYYVESLFWFRVSFRGMMTLGDQRYHHLGLRLALQ